MKKPTPRGGSTLKQLFCFFKCQLFALGFLNQHDAEDGNQTRAHQVNRNGNGAVVLFEQGQGNQWCPRTCQNRCHLVAQRQGCVTDVGWEQFRHQG